MIERYEHHGVSVSVQSHLKGKHREHCLCYENCRHFTPENRQTNCTIASLLYQLDVHCNVTTPVFECERYAEN